MNFVRYRSLAMVSSEMVCISKYIYISIPSETLDFTGFVVTIEEAVKAGKF